MSETSAPGRRLVTFGVFELDLYSGELRKSGARLSLQQQPLQVLLVMLERPGELITREDLRKRLWSQDTFVDFDQGLNAAIKRLRVTLGDSADSPRFIETVPRRGYRFIAPASASNGARSAGARPGHWPVRWVWVVLALTAGGALALGGRLLLIAPVQTGPIASAASEQGSRAPLVPLTTGSDFNTEPTLSPDGKWVAFASDRAGEGHLDIWMQGLSGGEAVRLTRDEADEREPSFTADGSRIAFRSERAGGGIYAISAHAGAEARLLVPGDAHGARFSPDGRWLVYSTGPARYGMDKDTAYFGHTYLAPAGGGRPTRLLPDFVSVAWPVWSPDSRRLLITARRHAEDDPEWWTVAPDGQAPVKISGVDAFTGIGRFPQRPWSWIEGNRIVYSAALRKDGWDLWEVAIAPTKGSVSSAPRRLTSMTGLHAHASIARGADVVFTSLTQTVTVWSIPLHANGGRVLGSARRVTGTPTLQWGPSVSADGRWLVFRGDKPGADGLWRRDLATETDALLVASSDAKNPVVTADGTRVAYRSTEDTWAIYGVPSAGGVRQPLCVDCGDAYVTDWSKDQKRLLYVAGNPAEVFVLDLRSGEKRRALQRLPNSLWQARFSPDDRWLTVLETLDAPGRTRLWIVPFTDGADPRADEWVSVTRGEHWDDKPRWSPDGNLLYFTSQRDGFHCLWAQRLQPQTRQPTGPPFAVQHFHSARLAMANTGFSRLETAVSHDRFFINLGELSGNIWTTRLQ
jgi:eukaryotic-like serine/threonine-protein kinase